MLAVELEVWTVFSLRFGARLGIRCLARGSTRHQTASLAGNLQLKWGRLSHDIQNFFQKHQTRRISASKLAIDPSSWICTLRRTRKEASPPRKSLQVSCRIKDQWQVLIHRSSWSGVFGKSFGSYELTGRLISYQGIRKYKRSNLSGNRPYQAIKSYRRVVVID